MILTTLTDKEIEKAETEIFDLAFEFQMKYFVDISVVLKMRNSLTIGLEYCRFMITYKERVLRLMDNRQIELCKYRI